MSLVSQRGGLIHGTESRPAAEMIHAQAPSWRCSASRRPCAPCPREGPRSAWSSATSSPRRLKPIASDGRRPNDPASIGAAAHRLREGSGLHPRPDPRREPRGRGPHSGLRRGARRPPRLEGGLRGQQEDQGLGHRRDRRHKAGHARLGSGSRGREAGPAEGWHLQRCLAHRGGRGLGRRRDRARHREVDLPAGASGSWGSGWSAATFLVEFNFLGLRKTVVLEGSDSNPGGAGCSPTRTPASSARRLRFGPSRTTRTRRRPPNTWTSRPSTTSTRRGPTGALASSTPPKGSSKASSTYRPLLPGRRADAASYGLYEDSLVIQAEATVNYDGQTVVGYRKIGPFASGTYEHSFALSGRPAFDLVTANAEWDSKTFSRRLPRGGGEREGGLRAPFSP